MSIQRGLLLGVLIACLAAPAAAQQSAAVTQTDIQRLQDSVYLADRDVSQSRSRDAARALRIKGFSSAAATASMAKLCSSSVAPINRAWTRISAATDSRPASSGTSRNAA